MISSIRLDLLEVLGDDYISQHIYNERYKEMIELSYRAYVTDGIMVFTGMKERWYKTIENAEKPKKPAPSIEEIYQKVISIH